MKARTKRLLLRSRNTLTVTLCLFSGVLWAQDISITQVKQVGGTFEISYDIIDEKLENRYSLQLYTSLDNYVQPLKMVDGDVGIDISVGENRKLIWNAEEELGGDFNDQVYLELKGNIYVPFITMQGLEGGTVIKRGQSKDLKWAGGRGDNILNMELYKGDNVVYVFDERPNVGNTSIVIPKEVKPGKNYRLRISDARNQDEVIYTEEFEIKRKVPLGVKLGASVLVGMAIGYLVASPGDPEEEKIGDPISPTRN